MKNLLDHERASSILTISSLNCFSSSRLTSMLLVLTYPSTSDTLNMRVAYVFFRFLHSLELKSWFKTQSNETKCLNLMCSKKVFRLLVSEKCLSSANSFWSANVKAPIIFSLKAVLSVRSCETCWINAWWSLCVFEAALRTLNKRVFKALIMLASFSFEISIPSFSSSRDILSRSKFPLFLLTMYLQTSEI